MQSKPLEVLVLAGDGIGPEVTSVAERVLERVASLSGLPLTLHRDLFGGASLDAHGVPITDEVLRAATTVDAVLLGAVGGPAWDALPPDLRPEKGLLRLRSHMGVFANLRPARCFPALAHASPLRPDLTAGVDILFVRELIGGIYFGEPRGLQGGPGARRAFNTMVYTEHEIRRILKVGFEHARTRRKHLTSVDKANVLEVQRLWRTIATEMAPDYPDVTLEHLYVDNCAMQLATRPAHFDVVVTSNLFGDILSDEAAALTGSLGVLPSAAIGGGVGLYEPVHGSAPDIAGKGVANPIAAVLSAAMLLRWSANRPDLADAVEAAVDGVLTAGLRTPDLYTGRPGEQRVGTEALGEAILTILTARLGGGS
jgi:3-isopropylmalate dehydrogenase